MNDEHAQMVTDCENRESRMSDWERGFIDGLGKVLADGKRSLTTKEADKLNEIWDRVTS